MIKKLLKTLPAYQRMNEERVDEEADEYYNIFINDLTDQQRTDLVGRMATLWNAWKNIIDNRNNVSRNDLLRLKKSKYTEIKGMFQARYTDLGFGRQPKG